MIPNRGETVAVRIGKSGTLICAFENEAACRGENCGEPIWWVVTPHGARMPVDPPEDDETPALPHWGSCQDAASFGGKREKEGRA